MLPGVSAQLRKGVVESCVLGLLSREPMYGWQLAQELIEQEMIASIGTLYPVLGRLRDSALVSTYEEASASGPTRKYYRLTAAGEESLAEFRRGWGPFTRAVDAMTFGDGS